MRLLELTSSLFHSHSFAPSNTANSTVLTATVQKYACRSLPIWGHEPVELGRVLIRIALASNTSSALAVLHALLAFSALHRYNVSAQAVELKISALGALTAVPDGKIGTLEAIQHVATGMLLMCFEVS